MVLNAQNKACIVNFNTFELHWSISLVSDGVYFAFGLIEVDVVVSDLTFLRKDLCRLAVEAFLL